MSSLERRRECETWAVARPSGVGSRRENATGHSSRVEGRFLIRCPRLQELRLPRATKLRTPYCNSRDCSQAEKILQAVSGGQADRRSRAASVWSGLESNERPGRMATSAASRTHRPAIYR